MAYEKQNFQGGQVLKAEHLNKIEDGIKAVEKDAGNLQSTVENLQSTVENLQPITSTIDITAGSAASDGRSYHVIE
jgi:uncharacterized protein YlxW (UPF0749 family)